MQAGEQGEGDGDGDGDGMDDDGDGDDHHTQQSTGNMDMVCVVSLESFGI